MPQAGFAVELSLVVPIILAFIQPQVKFTSKIKQIWVWSGASFAQQFYTHPQETPLVFSLENSQVALPLEKA